MKEQPVSKYRWLNVILDTWEYIIIGFDALVQFVDDIITDVVQRLKSINER